MTEDEMAGWHHWFQIVSNGFKQEKEYDKAVYCHPAYLTSMKNTLCEMPGWMKLD